MEDKISKFHKVVLWFSTVTCGIFGAGNYLFPDFFTSSMKVNEPDLISVSCVGGFLIAAAVGSIFSLKSSSWKEIKITTYYLMTWSLLNGLRLALHIVVNNDLGLLPNCISTLIIGIGLAFVVYNRIVQSRKQAV